MVEQGLIALRACAIASKVRQVIVSMAKMTASLQVIASAIMPLDFNRVKSIQNASEGSIHVQNQQCTQLEEKLNWSG